jgi:hypothetical protein
MDELYRDQILEHYKRPHNFGVVEAADLEYEDTNPFCGDEQHVTIKLDADDKVSEIAFEGKGCAISTAATSLLTDELTGMSARCSASRSSSPPPSASRPNGRTRARSATRPKRQRSRHLERVLGVGGYFLRATDPEALGAWYRDCLGLDADANGLWSPEAGGRADRVRDLRVRVRLLRVPVPGNDDQLPGRRP